VPRVTAEGQGNQVRQFRRINDLTQAKLAEAVDVSRQTVVSIEAGDYSPSVHLALRIAAVLETTVEELFAEDKDRP
jgi:putative transcriptional regulator